MSTDRLSLLRAAREHLVDAMENADIRELPAVVRELRAVLGEIDKIPGSGEVSELDLLADGIITDLDEHRRRRTAG